MAKKKLRTHRRFTDEFKKEAVNLVLLEGYSINAAAKAVGVSPNSLRGWYDKLVGDGDPTEVATKKDLETENKRLREELRQAKLECEVLKKATAYFAKESR